VSSDREVANYARDRRLRQLTSQQFAQELQRREGPSEAVDENEKPLPSQADTDEFMNLFGAEEVDE